VLTKITKYAAGTFFVLAVVLSLMQRTYHTRTTSAFEAGLTKSGPPAAMPAAPAQAPAVAPPTAPAPATKPAAAPGTNTLRIVPPPVEDTNLPVAIPAPPAAPAPTNK
jgi:hypothetical protein